VPDSPEELIAFFSRHVDGVAFNRHGQHHLLACEGALTKLRAFSLNDPNLACVVPEFQARLDAARSSLKRSAFRIVAGSIIAFLALLSFVSFMAGNQTGRHARARDEVQKLIGQGRFKEARVRAQDLESKQDVDQMFQMIDKAEKSSKLRSQ